MLKITRNEKFNKRFDIVEEILNFSKQQKVKRLRILTPDELKLKIKKATCKKAYTKSLRQNNNE